MGLRVGKIIGPDNKMNYTGPREGSDLLDFIGPAKGVVQSGTKGMSQGQEKHSIISWVVSLNDKGCEGKTIVANKATSGDDRGGQALERQTLDVLVSCGYSLEQLEAFFVQCKQAYGEAYELPEEEAIKMCMGRPCYVDIGVSRSWKTNQVISTIDNFISAEMYAEKEKTPGTFRQPRPEPPQNQQRGPSAPMIGGAPNIGGGVSVPGVQAPGAFGPRGLPGAPQFAVPGQGAPQFATPPAPGTAPGAPGMGMQPPPFAQGPQFATPPAPGVPNGGVPAQGGFQMPAMPGMPARLG